MPTIPELFGHAVLHYQQGRLAEAAECFRQALHIDPNDADARNNLGNVLGAQGLLTEAADCYRQTLASNPAHANAYYNLGNVLFSQGQFVPAGDCYRRALERNPQHAEALNNLGNALVKQGLVLVQQGFLAAAAESFASALRLNPKNALAHNNLGNIYFKQGLTDEAMACYRQALFANPNYADAHVNLGNAFLGQSRLEEAAGSFQHALVVDPLHKVALWNLALLRLLQGDFAGGWPDYEQRWAQPGRKLPSFAQPRWDGSALEGKTILVHAEQGFGDTFQFMRYLPLVRRRGGTVVFECQKSLVKLLTGLSGVDHLVSAGDLLPSFDVQIPLLSLPGIFGATETTIPAEVPYLRTDPGLVDEWRERLNAITQAPNGARLTKTQVHLVKVGIVWQGDPRHQWDQHRSFPLAMVEPLAQIPGVALVSLQRGPGAKQLADLGERFSVVNLGPALVNFSDTAALIQCLDLVICCDTAVAHLAGALGTPVWLALSTNVDWRWLLGRDDSPWYPTMRLFRQKRLGAWGEVFDHIGGELRHFHRSGESGS